MTRDPESSRLPLPDGPSSLTKTEAAYSALRLGIEEGPLKPGVRLRMGDLQRDLAMSPTPIREALRLLQADGLVEHRPHRGMVVAELPAERVEEVYRIRAALEPMATELAVQRASDARIGEIRDLHERLMRAIAEGRRADQARLNAAWHRAIYASCGSRYLEEFISRLWNALPVQAVWMSGHAPDSAAEHQAIMDAFEQREAKLAARLMRRHITAGAKMTARRLRRVRQAKAQTGA